MNNNLNCIFLSYINYIILRIEHVSIFKGLVFNGDPRIIKNINFLLTENFYIPLNFIMTKYRSF